MTLEVGVRLGPYEIASPLGAGGMGEVYRARDTRLERTVAIKVLPAHLSSTPEARRRFEREAKAISQLSHPHICALFDVGHQDTTQGPVDYLVMEFIEGETLEDRLAKGVLPIDQALRYGIETASALDMAHRQGIVHRDLKPGNVMLTKSGVKLLDFGLAKTTVPAGRPPAASAATTRTQLTQEGTIVGTFQYMALEQLEGEEADTRTDIFAFGAMLYEMATGKRAFTGGTPASVIASILSSEPPAISTIQPTAPPGLDRIVRKCLAKDPEDRWQSAADLGSELKWIAGEKALAEVPALPSRGKIRERLIWSVVGALLGGLIVSLALWNSIRAVKPERRPGARLAVALSATQPLAYSDTHMLALSPDGRLLVYVGARGDTQQLYVRPIAEWNALPIPGTEGAKNPFFSPDGQWVAFFADDQLKKVSLDGGEPVSLCRSPNIIGGTWGTNGTIVFNSGFTSGLFSIPAGGGSPKRITIPDAARRERAHLWPQLLPGGKSVLLTIWTGGTLDDSRIAIADLASGRVRTLFTGGTDARYVPSGHIVYARGGSVLAVPFDGRRLEVTGPPVTVLGGVLSGLSNGESQFDCSLDGLLAYVPGDAQVNTRMLVWVDRTGASVPASDIRRNFTEPALSPDGRRLAVTVEGFTFDVWVLEFARRTLTRMSFGEDDASATWTRDGKRIAWSSSRGGVPNLFWRSSDGSGSDERLTTSTHPQFPSSFSPDGKALLFVDGDRSTGADLWVLPLEGERTPRPFLRTPFKEREGSFSPDGKWIAYTSNESGREEVYVSPFPGGGGRVQISPDGGSEPAWSPRGGQLFYQQGERMMAVSIETEPSLSAGKPVTLFEAKYDEGFAVSPDGQRFLMIKENEDRPAAQQINVEEGWFDELRSRVPPGAVRRAPRAETQPAPVVRTIASR
jgi:serine/threonine protein kinase/Tol biopolymer transport system component